MRITEYLNSKKQTKDNATQKITHHDILALSSDSLEICIWKARKENTQCKLCTMYCTYNFFLESSQ